MRCRPTRAPPGALRGGAGAHGTVAVAFIAVRRTLPCPMPLLRFPLPTPKPASSPPSRALRRALAALAVCALPGLPARAQAPAPPAGAATVAAITAPAAVPAPWVPALQRGLERAATLPGATAFGVYVRDLDTGDALSFHGAERWYLASSVKVPVAVAVLRGVERGAFTLDTPLTLREADYVDGAGPTKRQAAGTPLTVRWLLEQMIVFSDNTASDMLIELVGLPAVNAVAQEAAPGGLERITTLADVRRQAYAQLTPEALHLSGRDFLELKAQRGDREVKDTLARLLHVAPASLRPLGVGEAFEAYYATGLNSGRLDAYGELLAQLAQGRLLNPAHTRYLLGVMERVQTGPQRIKAGLPAGVTFAHKTGTQRARTCDSGLITRPADALHPHAVRAIVVACTRGEPSTTRSDRTLRQVGIAICQSGLLTHGKPHDLPCPTTAAAASTIVHPRAAAARAGAVDGDLLGGDEP